MQIPASIHRFSPFQQFHVCRRFFTVAAMWLCLFLHAVAGPPKGVPESATSLTGDGFSVPAWAHKNFLYLEVPSDTTEPEIRIPRLANVVRDVEWVGREDSRLAVHPEPARWIIKPGAVSKETPAVVVMTLDTSPTIFAGAVTVSEDATGILFLPAKFALTRGNNLRYEPQPHKNTVGYWSNEKDTAEWKFEVKSAGKFEIDILQGCGKGHGGSDVELRIEDQAFPFQVLETGHFQNFVWRTLGTVELNEPGVSSLRLVPVQKVGGAVMDVRAIRLVPAGLPRSFESELADPQSLPKSESKIPQQKIPQ